MSTGEVLEHEHFEYAGDVAACKGGNSKSEMNQANQLQTQEMQLMQQQLSQLNQKLSPFLTANQQLMQNTQNVVGINNQILANGGLTPQQQQAFTAQAINQATRGYGNAVGQINNALVARGISGGQFGAGGGGIGQQYGQLGAALGGQMQNAIGGINNLKFQSFENALNMNSGLFQNSMANQLNVAKLYGGLTGGFNQGGLGALNAGVIAADNADRAQVEQLQAWTGLAGNVLGGLTRGLGQGVGSLIGVPSMPNASQDSYDEL